MSGSYTIWFSRNVGCWPVSAGGRLWPCWAGAVDERKPYNTDLTEPEWALITPLIAAWKAKHPSVSGHQGRYSMREIVNALRYQNRTGCQWELLPHDLLPDGAAYQQTMDMFEHERRALRARPVPRAGSAHDAPARRRHSREARTPGQPRIARRERTRIVPTAQPAEITHVADRRP
jgi:transposase